MDKSDLEERAEVLEDFVRVLIEFGLFTNDSEDPGAILEKIELARKRIASDALPEAATALTEGERETHAALMRRSFLWRWTHLYQLPVGVYYLAVFGALLVWALFPGELWKAGLLGVPMPVIVAGSLGAILRGTWWLHRQVAQRIYRPHFVLAHLLAPFIGALFGTLSFLLLKAGVLSLGVTGGDTLNEAALPLAVGFFAGYSWEWMIAKLDQLRSQ